MTPTDKSVRAPAHLAKKSVLQRISTVFGLATGVLALVSGLAFYFRVEEVGFNNPVSASLLACFFFFAFVTVVLTIIGRSNLPSFSFDEDSQRLP